MGMRRITVNALDTDHGRGARTTAAVHALDTHHGGGTRTLAAVHILRCNLAAAEEGGLDGPLRAGLPVHLKRQRARLPGDTSRPDSHDQTVTTRQVTFPTHTPPARAPAKGHITT
jgi:hypothetical protein